jgi:hypothetical protein
MLEKSREFLGASAMGGAIEDGFGADGSVARLDVVQRVIFELPAVELGLALES